MTAPTSDGDELLTAAEVAELAKCSERTVRRLMQTGRLGFVLIGRERRIPRSAWRQFATTTETTPGSPDPEAAGEDDG